MFSAKSLARYWSKVKKTDDGCWEWVGSRQQRGDGNLRAAGRDYLAHRVSWEIAHGPIPAGMLICHHCDNPPCVRPDHLFLGTQADNIRDMFNKGRSRGSQSKLSAKQVAEIRRARQSGEKVRVLARLYGVHRNTIYALISGRTYKERTVCQDS